MRKTLLIAFICIALLATAAYGKKTTPCDISDIPEKTERLQQRILCLGWISCAIDSIRCESLGVEAWMGMSRSESTIVAEWDDGIWYVSLTKFFRYVAKPAFKIFDDAENFRIIVFESEGTGQRDRYGNIQKKQATAVARLEMTRKTYDKVNWDYVDQLDSDYHQEVLEKSFLGSEADFGFYKEKYLAMLDHHWIHRKYTK